MKARRLAVAAIPALVMAAISVATAQQPAPGAGPQAAPSFQYFFTAKDQAFEAYYDPSSRDLDSDGDRLVTVRMTKFSAAFRDWVKTNFPGGETADYAVDTYSIDCDKKLISEHRLVWFDNTGTELTDFDFGGALGTPARYSLKDNLMRKVCGLEQ